MLCPVAGRDAGGATARDDRFVLPLFLLPDDLLRTVKSYHLLKSCRIYCKAECAYSRLFLALLESLNKLVGRNPSLASVLSGVPKPCGCPDNLWLSLGQLHAWI